MTQDRVQQNNYQKPDHLLMPTLKVIRKLYDGKTEFADGVQPVNVGSKKEKKIVVVPVELIFDDPLMDAVERCLTPFDKLVQNGTFTLIGNGYAVFSAKQVYEMLAGKTTTNPQAIDRVVRSIEKQRRTLITIDWTAHAKMNGLQLEDQSHYMAMQERLLVLQDVTLCCNGQEVAGYSVCEEPVLYRYAKQIGQIASIDRKLLSVPVSNTTANILIKNELLERIDTIRKRGKMISNHVAFETLYELAGVGESRTEKQRLRHAVEKMLKSWQKEGFFSAYILNSGKGRRIESITIVV